jgi:hypothetical protein
VFLIGLIYLAAALCALTFFGACLLRILLPGLRHDRGLGTAFGIAAYLAICGALEVTRSGSRPLLLALVAVGVVGFIITSREPWVLRLPTIATAPRAALLGFATFAGLYALFLVNAADWHYGFLDDVLGYLVFPERILSEGSIGRDPFNYRRIESGLTGGGSYLYALFRAALPMRQTRLADVGVGSACLLLLVAAHAREQGLAGMRLAGMLLIALAFIAFGPLWNNTPDTTGKALLFALYRLAFVLQSRPPSPRRGAALGFLFFAAVALKTSYLPAAVGGLAAFYVASFATQSPLRVIVEAVATAIAATAVMLPWMLASYATAQTPWYPVLGTGTLSPLEVSGIAAPYMYLTEAGRLLVIVAPALLIALGASRSLALRGQRLFLASLAPCSTALTLASQLKITVFGYRYGLAGVTAVTLFYLPLAARWQPVRLLRLGLVCLVALGLLTLVTKDRGRTQWFDSGWIAELILGPAHYEPGQWRNDLGAQLHAMQAAVPPGAPMLVLLSWPALLDFQRNPIAVMDHAGMMGPGHRPAANDPAGWSRYLLGLGIRYVAYSYADEAAFTTSFARRERNRYNEPWQASAYVVADATANIEMRETLLALRDLGTVIYDDGNEFVIRLNNR